MSEEKTAGTYRKELYELIQQVIGRPLTDNEHKYISNHLKNYVNAHAPTEPLIKKPIEHHYICGNCHNIKKGIGHNFSSNMDRKIRKQKDPLDKTIEEVLKE